MSSIPLHCVGGRDLTAAGTWSKWPRHIKMYEAPGWRAAWVTHFLPPLIPAFAENPSAQLPVANFPPSSHKRPDALSISCTTST